jgi:hypothetical protein
MGVTYKLRDEVVQFIISQRQSNPLFSCRQLAESVSQKFSLHLSKSSVHDVLKESGIITPRGRKPRPKFEIPQEKKLQIQDSLSQIKLLPAPTVILSEAKDLKESKDFSAPPEYEGAGRIFLKAALWDLGIYSEKDIKEQDWDYYLTYSKGVKVVLENNKDFFIDLSLPLERCIREVADGLINNIKPFIVHKVSDEGLFKASMDGQTGFKIDNLSIVDYKDHILFFFDNIMEYIRNYYFINRVFVESVEKDFLKRSKTVFFSQHIGNNEAIDGILNLRGFNTINKDEESVNLLIDNSYENKSMLQKAGDQLNGMYLRNEQDRLVSVKIVILGEAKDLQNNL